MRRGAAALAVTAGLLAGPAAGAQAAADPAGAWSFDEAAPVTGAASAAAGRFGRALAFDGGASGASLGSLPRLRAASALTVEAWVRPAALGRRRVAVHLDGLPHGLFARRGLPLNTWSHLALSYDGATLRSYVDGALVGSGARAGLTAAGSLQLGRDFSGLLDELRVYDRALGAAEIAADRDTPIASVGLLTRPGAAAAKPRAASRGRRTRLLARAF